MRDIICNVRRRRNFVAIIHGVLGETKVFARATIQRRVCGPDPAGWQPAPWRGSAAGLLIARTSLGSEAARHWITATIIAVTALRPRPTRGVARPRLWLEGARRRRRACSAGTNPAIWYVSCRLTIG